MERAKLRMPSRKFIQNRSRGILRPVIHRDDLEIGIVQPRKGGQCRRQLFFFIPRRENQRNSRAISIFGRSTILDPRQAKRTISHAQSVKNPEESDQSGEPDSREVLEFCRRNWCQRSPRGILARDAKLIETNTRVNRLNIAVAHTKLANGLSVVVAPDTTAPVVTVGVYYKIGFRLEPQGRSGFAHLFEHMMFQGSANAPKMQHIKLINSSGGVLNGSTSYDVTNYYEAVPSNALERVLWLEADRMRALKVDDENLKNQLDVVKEEVRVNVMNQPYGGFPWLDMPPVAFRNWANAHNFYGDFADLDAADLADVQAFFKTYYVPNNAVLLMLGDVKAEEGIALARKHFGEIPAGAPPPFADPSEPEQTEERRGNVEEKFGTLPAMAIGYLMPKRRTADWCAMALLDQALHGGRAGRMHRELVLEKQIAVEAGGGIDDLFGYNGPTQMTTRILHKSEYSG